MLGFLGNVVLALKESQAHRNKKEKKKEKRKKKESQAHRNKTRWTSGAWKHGEGVTAGIRGYCGCSGVWIRMLANARI